MPRDMSEEWILDDFTPPTPPPPRQIIRVQKNGELSPVWHTVNLNGDTRTWDGVQGQYVDPPNRVLTWCSACWYDDEGIVDYDSQVHDQRECGTCVKKLHNNRTGYSSRLAKVWLRDGVQKWTWREVAPGHPASHGYGGWPYCDIRFIYKRDDSLQSALIRRDYEVMSVTEFGEREIQQFLRTVDYGNSPAGQLIRITWQASPEGKRVGKKQRKQIDESRKQSKAQSADYWRRKNMLDPRWVTTNAQQYRHILLGYPMANDIQEWRDIACGNKITVHMCKGEELELPICPRCALAYKDELIEAELTLPDGTKLPDPMVKRIMALDPRNKEKES